MTSTIAPGQYRLATLQVYNWGTFNGLHTVDVARAGFLIFGPSGSGKSTLIDAVSTILGSPDVTVLTPQQPNPGRNPAEIWSPTAVVRGKRNTTRILMMLPGPSCAPDRCGVG